jgi:hypothetical protein
MSIALIIVVNVALDAAILAALAYVCTRATRLRPHDPVRGATIARSRRTRNATTHPSAPSWRLTGERADARA